jgi:transposase-like protein
MNRAWTPEERHQAAVAILEIRQVAKTDDCRLVIDGVRQARRSRLAAEARAKEPASPKQARPKRTRPAPQSPPPTEDINALKARLTAINNRVYRWNTRTKSGIRAIDRSVRDAAEAVRLAEKIKHLEETRS